MQLAPDMVEIQVGVHWLFCNRKLQMLLCWLCFYQPFAKESDIHNNLRHNNLNDILRLA